MVRYARAIACAAHERAQTTFLKHSSATWFWFANRYGSYTKYMCCNVILVFELCAAQLIRVIPNTLMCGCPCVPSNM